MSLLCSWNPNARAARVSPGTGARDKPSMHVGAINSFATPGIASGKAVGSLHPRHRATHGTFLAECDGHVPARPRRSYDRPVHRSPRFVCQPQPGPFDQLTAQVKRRTTRFGAETELFRTTSATVLAFCKRAGEPRNRRRGQFLAITDRRRCGRLCDLRVDVRRS